MQNMCMELVTYRLKEEVTVERYMPYVHQLQEALIGAEGYRNRSVYYNADSGVWAEMIEWDSAEAAKAQEERLMKEPFMREAMTLIDPVTIQMNVMRSVLQLADASV